MMIEDDGGSKAIVLRQQQRRLRIHCSSKIRKKKLLSLPRYVRNGTSTGMLLVFLGLLVVGGTTTIIMMETATAFSFSTYGGIRKSSSSVAIQQQEQQRWRNNFDTITTTTSTTATSTTALSSDTTAITETSTITDIETVSSKESGKFDIDTALFCAGLAFDAYVEPPPDSSRWERGSKGMNVAFVSSKYTRNLYRGMVEVTPMEATDLPEEDDTIESVATGNGVDVCLMCAVLEGKLWKDDVEALEKDSNHNGIFSLNGAAHVGRSRTAWANVDVNKSNASKRKSGDALPYHISKTLFKSGKSIWPDTERPYYLYVQDPQNVQLVFSLFDDDVIGDGSVISSHVVSLKELIPKVGTDIVDTIKQQLVPKLVEQARNDPNMSLDETTLNNEVQKAIGESVDRDYKWEGTLKMTVKPKIENKNGQMAAGAAAGAMIAGPVGAAAGAAFGAFYEGAAKGSVKMRLRYLPVPPSAASLSDSEKYRVLGGLPGIDWGKLYEMNLFNDDDGDNDESGGVSDDLKTLGGDDLEFCFFINHDETGASVGVYRSVENKRIVVSFRGTCQPIDLITDASILQVPWVDSEYDEQTLQNIDHENFPMVHVGFRKSMDSISRRLKTLILGTAIGAPIEEYEILVTGHSLGGALATLFTADIAEYGIDAGRSLPQKAPSEPWWKGIATTLMGDDDKNAAVEQPTKGPPRPKSLKMYNFGSPRAGNTAFSNQFEEFIKDGRIDEAYRIVNSQDIIARVPRTMIKFDYEHCGRTVLIEEPLSTSSDDNDAEEGGDSLVDTTDIRYALWIEGESDFERIDPVRDIRGATKGILEEGTLLDDLVQTVSKNDKDESGSGGVFNQLGAVAERLTQMDVADVTSMVGIDRTYANREIELAQSFVKGESLAHHLEDSYYMAMGRAVGFNTTVGEEISPL